MQRYEVGVAVGDGSFGRVALARHRGTGEQVAIKKMKMPFSTWAECVKLREVTSLTKLKHPSIIKLREVIHERGELYFVFEYMPDGNLFDVIQREGKSGELTEARIKSIMHQLLSGLAYMHKHGFFHRDIKPDNLLCRGSEVKIGDFGQARETRSRPPYTDYISTRWYRAPEVLLRCSHYNSPIDIWAAGTIMAEMYNRRPLLPGTSEVHQMLLTCEALGSPSPATWSEGCRAASKIGFKFPAGTSPKSMRELVPTASKPARALLRGLLQLDPNKRATAAQALASPFFAEMPRSDSLMDMSALNTAMPSPTRAPARIDEGKESGGGGMGGAGGYSSYGSMPRTPDEGKYSEGSKGAHASGSSSRIDDDMLSPVMASPGHDRLTSGDGGVGAELSGGDWDGGEPPTLVEQKSLDTSALEELLASLEAEKLGDEI